MWRDTRRSHSITRVQAYSRFHGKMLECCPLSTGLSSSLARGISPPPSKNALRISCRCAVNGVSRLRCLGITPGSASLVYSRAGSLAMLLAIGRASSIVSTLAVSAVMGECNVWFG